MYSMKKTCKLTGLSYETLKFYCNQGLIPNVKRDNLNYRIFDDRDIAWIGSLICLKNCGMNIKEMKEYIDLCMQGKTTLLKRKQILSEKRKRLEQELEKIQTSIEFIDQKQQLYDDMISGKVKYYSNLIHVDDEGNAKME